MSIPSGVTQRSRLCGLIRGSLFKSWVRFEAGMFLDVSKPFYKANVIILNEILISEKITPRVEINVARSSPSVSHP
ncbi:hypothetical protein VTN96DRAFT_3445 [Rasamsonia emersonii]